MKCPKCDFDNPENTNFCGNCAEKLTPVEDAPDIQTATLDIGRLPLRTGGILAGRYEIIELLGQGGMGWVYKVNDTEIGEKIALKLIRPEIASRTKTIQRFQQELKLARRIAHPHVCRMYDLGKDGATQFITMEYVSGENLKSSLRRIGPLTAARAIAVGKQLCQGLSEAHRLGVIHRDLKPHNVMIDHEGNAKIMDFGIALAPDDEEGITESGVVMGTPKYYSPEQVEGRPLDARSDIYSLGIMLFEMVTGKAPFEADSTLAIAVKHTVEPPPDPVEINPHTPPELSQLILRCLAKDPQERYQTAADLCADLTRIEKEIPEAESTSRSRLRQETGRLRRQLLRFPGIVLFLAAIIIGGYLLRDQLRKKGAAETQAADSPLWRNSLIVLPFAHTHPQAGQEYLRQTVNEEIIRRLSKFNEIRVINSRTSWQFRDSELTNREIGRQLDIDNVLIGSMDSQKSAIDIRIELSSAADGHVILSESYSCEIGEDLFTLLDTISKAVAKGLDVALVDDRYPGIVSRDSTDLDATRHYRYGRHFELRYYDTYDDADFQSSLDNYKRAIAFDPNYALVYWHLGVLHEVRYNRDDNPVDLEQMYHYFQQAYEIDPDLAEANLGIGWKYFNREEHDRAYQFFKRAYEADTNSAEVNFHVGAFLRSLGLYAQAQVHYERALALDPVPEDFYLWHRVLADGYMTLGEVEKGIETLKNALKMRPDHRFMQDLAMGLIIQGRHTEADTMLSRAESLAPDSLNLKLHRALFHAVTGDRARALELMKLEERTYRQIMTSLYALTGRKEEAIRNIRLGSEEGFARERFYTNSYLVLKNNPFYDSLRAEPGFQEILKKEKAIYEERVRKYGDL